MQERLQAGQTVAGYRLLRAIGSGAHGSVFLARHDAAAADVALKLVPLAGDKAGAVRGAFMRAADTARRLQHPGIVAVHDAGVDGSLAWLAMEAVAGGDLGACTEPASLLAEARVIEVAERVALALAYAHRQGVVHRDLKPANVLVDWPGATVKLGDFGLARATDALQTGTGLVPGSPAYMAPEQLAGAVPTAQSDFYALGAMLFQLLAGRLPFEAHSMGELLRQVVSAPAPDLLGLRPALVPGLAELVAQLLAKRPDQRPLDGDAIATRLRALRRAPRPPL